MSKSEVEAFLHVESIPPTDTVLKWGLKMAREVIHSSDMKVKPTDYKRVWVFTDHDDPSGSNKNERDLTIQTARDLVGLDVNIELWYFNDPQGSPFSVKKFYEEILPYDEDDLADKIAFDASRPLDTVFDAVRRKEVPKRKYKTLAFSVTADEKFGVALYHIVHQSRKAPPVELHANTNKPLKAKTNIYVAETGKEITTQDITYYVELASEQVKVLQDEFKRLNEIGEAGKFACNDKTTDVDLDG